MGAKVLNTSGTLSEERIMRAIKKTKRGQLRHISLNFKSAVGKAALLALVLGLLATVLSQGAFAQTGGMTALFSDDFEDGTADDWELETGWGIELENGNHVLSGKGHSWARPVRSEGGGTITSFETRIKRLKGGIHLNFRLGPKGTRYFVGVNEDRLYLNKSILKDPVPTEGDPFEHPELIGVRLRLDPAWHTIKVTGNGNNLKVYIDGQLMIDYTDEENPHLSGSVAFETLPDSHFYFDDVVVMGEAPPEPPPGYVWKKLGGPLGGLGYDIRMRPDNLDIMYVTDAWAGVHKSTDGGLTWVSMNEGIDARTGPSGDAIPVFCLTIDPNNYDIIWIGTQNVRGIYRSADGGRTWEKRVNGVVEDSGLTFRGFTVEPGNSDVVYAAGEISSFNWAGREMWGREFDRTKGVVYKSSDAGRNWRAIWRGDNLARYVWIDPSNVNTIYVSTGIFDREAANSDPMTNTPGGVGILKSTDGGETWFQVNNGLNNLYLGTLFMHPDNPQILLAGAGNNAYPEGGGIYLTTDGGAQWKHVGGRHITSVEFAAGDSRRAYAGGDSEFYRSDDGGRTWQSYKRAGEGWGPEGIRPGFPIDFQVNPRDSMRIFVNNYGGGNFLSQDGGQTWVSASTGYTGADLTDLAVDPSNPAIVYANGRSGPFVSTDGGATWRGLNTVGVAEGARVVVDPDNPNHILMSSAHWGETYESIDGGLSWKQSTNYGKELENLPWPDVNQKFQGMQAITFAPSTPEKVYGGFGVWRCATDADEQFRNTSPIVSILTSEDGGRTWTRHQGTALDGLTVTEIVVHPLNADIAWAATVGGGVFHTSDGGATWESASNGLVDKRVMDLAIGTDNPDVLYAGTAKNGVFKTEDGGATWQSVSAGMNPNEPIGALVVNPVQPNIVYAGSWSSGVFLSTDAGASWQLINDGLSTRSVRALAISSDGKVLYAGTRGEGVFRLGELPPEAVSVPTTPPPTTQPPVITTPPATEAPPTTQAPAITTPPTTQLPVTKEPTPATEKTGSILPYLGGGLLLLVLIGWGFWRWHYRRKIVK